MAHKPLRFRAVADPDYCWVLGVVPPPGGLRRLKTSDVYSNMILHWELIGGLLYPVCGNGRMPHNVAMMLPNGMIRHDMEGTPALWSSMEEWVAGIRNLS